MKSVTEKIQLDDDERVPTEKSPRDWRRTVSGVLNFLIIDITGKFTGVLLFAALSFALLTEADTIQRNTGLEYWQLFAGLIVFAWALWLWLMMDRRDD